MFQYFPSKLCLQINFLSCEDNFGYNFLLTPKDEKNFIWKNLSLISGEKRTTIYSSTNPKTQTKNVSASATLWTTFLFTKIWRKKCRNLSSITIWRAKRQLLKGALIKACQQMVLIASVVRRERQAAQSGFYCLLSLRVILSLLLFFVSAITFTFSYNFFNTILHKFSYN